MSRPISSLFIAASIAVSLVSEPVYSQENAGLCSQKNSIVFYGNGIWSPCPSAFNDLMELKTALSSTFPPDEYQKIDFDQACNNSTGFPSLADLLEAFTQDISSDVSSFWRSLAWLVPDQALANRLTEFSTAIDRAQLLNNQDLSTQIAAYKNAILEGKKVIVVAHSQGNFFANESYGNLTASEQSSFGIVAVANPDSFVATGGPHVTIAGVFPDLVIAAIILAKQRAGLPTPQLPNVINFSVPTDLTGHFFHNSYFVPNSSSKSRILGDIVSVRAGLQQPANGAGQGIITITLTWGAQPDVDLHVFEPNGAHVYYANRIGPSGFLDRDVVTGFGPEHYFVGCDTVETGNYRVGVNYFRGSAPEVANVLIQAGLIERGFSVFLPTALGTAGNANPTPVGTVAVTGDRQNGFNFDIQ